MNSLRRASLAAPADEELRDSETSHTYNADKAREVHGMAITFADDAEKLLAAIEERLRG